MQDPIHKKSWFPPLILTVLTGALLWYLFGPVLKDPGAYMFATSGDGLNISYTSSYFVKYVEKGVHHPAFCYPFGNHLVYDDVNPILSMVLRFISHNVVDISNKVIGTINVSILLGFFPCVWAVYYLLRKSLLPRWYSVVFAMLIAFMSPQVGRFTGHLTLSYVFYVPIVWILVLKLFEAIGSWKWLGLYVLWVSIFAFVHPYYFLIAAGFLMSYLIIYALQHRHTFRQNRISYLKLFIAAVLPVIILKSWEILTNTGATDFVNYPYGFLLFTSSFKQIFYSSYEPLYSFWDGLFNIKPFEWEEWLKWEGVALVGLAGLLILIALGIRVLLLLWKRRFSRIGKPVFPNTLRTSIWAATLLLIWAMGYPFKAWPELLDYISFVRQFRSQGRLTWPFYYVYMTLCAYFLYVSYRALHIRFGKVWIKIAGIVVISLCLCFWTYEASLPMKEKRNFILKSQVSNALPQWNYDYYAVLNAYGYHPDDFQAILSFPFFHFGTEKFSLTSFHSTRNAMSVSYRTGLPMLNSYVARAPLSTSLKTIQLLSDARIAKELTSLFPNNKPLLLIWSHEVPPPRERAIIALADSITQVGDIRMAKLDIDAFPDIREEILSKFSKEKDSLYRKGDLFVNKKLEPIHFETFGDEPDSLGGKFLAEDGKKMILFDQVLDADSSNVPMETSFWVKIDVKNEYLPAVILEQYDGANKVEQVAIEIKFTTDVYKGWARAKIDWNLQKPGNRLYMWTFSKVEHFQLDNLLIRPREVNVYAEGEEGRLVYNNYIIDP